MRVFASVVGVLAGVGLVLQAIVGVPAANAIVNLALLVLLAFSAFCVLMLAYTVVAECGAWLGLIIVDNASYARAAVIAGALSLLGGAYLGYRVGI